MSSEPYDVEISDETLDDLRDRLSRTRWPDQVTDAGWEYGANLEYMRELVEYWRDDFDWREQEATINEFDHYRAEVGDTGIHYIHERGAGDNSTPLVLLHGWPGSFVQMLDIIPLLTDPKSHGGDPAESFDVIVPSLPGYGFSDRPSEPGMSLSRIADLFDKLLIEEIGYERYAVRGSDLGSGIIQQLAVKYPDSLIGTHQSGTNPFIDEEQIPEDPTEAEQEFLDNAQNWNQQEMAYAMEHSTKPQTLSYGLNESPSGLAAWIIEKFRTLSHNDGDIEDSFTKDELLTNLTVYWATETIGSSIRLYYEMTQDPGEWGEMNTPTAMLMSSHDMFETPREWVERTQRVDRWTEVSRGGHFLEWEEPELVAEDICEFFATLDDPETE
ncbi:epoxide hydrolase family protein [Halococcus salifodinae]|uniref:Epoxide hydrolase-like protein n=1 Tax=Halococcus salifodinae DSM 8989 TaxID=1227456 RepID=M0N9L8_9EURY|nr:epoxide hydrolase family protein [Halococcus salifodinae]EMA54551.1 epoxide hydrolase-like protein [Halococcus salifodinae DSM 8989]